MAYVNRPFSPTTRITNQVITELLQANTNFDILANAFQNDDPTTFVVKHALQSDTASYVSNADTVDGYHASVNPAPYSIPVLDSNGVLDLSTSYIKSDVYSFRKIDLSNATSNYLLRPGETAIIMWDTTQSLYKPSRITTEEGLYEVDVATTSSTQVNGYISIYPNNTTYTNQFYYGGLGLLYGGTTAQVKTGNISFFNGINLNGMTKSWVLTWTANKSFVSIINGWLPDYNNYGMYFFVNQWREYSTQWTNLGTFVADTSNGLVIIRVRRLV
jgi:hypothetical protein